jgi:DNA-binding transcriptional MerR regulator
MSPAASAERWVDGRPGRATYSISAVLEALQGEFPSLTVSKLRYLEEQGLLTPERTAAGYRRYSELDVARLAWVLAQQRDNFLPLKVIRARLAQLDASGGSEALAVPVRGRPARVQAQDVAAVTGQAQSLVLQVAEAAGVSAESADGALIQAVEAAVELAGFGLQLRHLKPLFQGAQRQADLVQMATAAARGQGSAAQERAAHAAADCADALARLNAAVLHLKLTGQ